MISSIKYIVSAFCVVMFAISTFAHAEEDRYPGKKMIVFGRVPTSEYVRDNIREMEKIAFDGLIIADGQNWKTWSTQPLDMQEFQPLIDNVKATKFDRFTDNFLRINTHFPSKESTADWFDADWSAVATNAGLTARAAKECGFKGIVIDTEQYGEGDSRMWDYSGDKLKRPFSEYREQVKERGREFIRAINKEFSDPVLFLTWGYELPVVYPHPTEPGGQPGYALLIPFLDGIIEAASPGTVLVNGYEYAYGFVSKKAFMGGKEMVKNTVRSTITSEPEAFDKHVQYGCPIYPDMWSGFGSLPFVFDDVEANLVTPALLRTMMANALAATDKYVWVYTEHLYWWDHDAEFGVDAPIEYRKANVPQEYIEAVSMARKGPTPGPHPDKITWPNAMMELPASGWRFALDSTVAKASAECVKVGYDDSAWQEVIVNEIPSYEGKTWYRIKFNGAALADNMRAFLRIPTHDEIAGVWLNGGHVGDRDINRYGARGFVVIEVSKFYKSGEDNVLVLRMENREGPSGISGPIKLSESGYVQIK